jgi:UDP-glucose 4-epimerase
MTDKILITGGRGYVGGRVVRLLAESGFSLRVGTHRSGLPTPAWLKDADLVHLDLLAAKDLDAACQGVRQVVHLAAVNEIVCAQDPEQALLVNGLGTLKLLRAALRVGVQRFIYFSTAHIYGSPLAGRITEEILPRPVHPYAITHRVAEDFVLAAHRQGAVQGVVLRLSNGFGPPAEAHVDRWTLLVNDLCRQAVTSGKLTLRTSGLQWRDFIPLTDVARAVKHVLELPDAELGDGVFNLGGEQALRVLDLANRIAARGSQVLNLTSPIIRPAPEPGEVHEPLDYRIDRLKGTGFRLTGDMDDEIDGTLKFCHQLSGGTK